MADERPPGDSNSPLHDATTHGIPAGGNDAEGTGNMPPGFTDGATMAVDRPTGTHVGIPDQIGPYRPIQLLGEGGFGYVYLAEQEKPVRRRVALKLIKPGLGSDAVIGRFEAERQALAMMDHPNIASILDAGTTSEGVPYFVMEYIAGEPVTSYCDRHKLSIPKRLDLFKQLCDAVHYAHQKGIIHRDLKPGNILVTVAGDQPTIRVIDFGIAKAIHQPLTEKQVFTEYGQLIGTPEYMSPEQAEMTALEVDTRSDIYSLGVILYELLTGALPFDPRALREAGYAGIQRMIREIEPPKPSTRLSTLISAGTDSSIVARKREVETAGSLTRSLRGDLDWITMKCLEKDRTRRYQSANELVADIDRFIKKEPVLAGPPSATYRARKFISRHRSIVLGSAAVVMALIIGTIVSTWLAVRATNAEHLATERATQLELANTEITRQRDRVREQRDEAVRLANDVIFEMEDEIEKLVGSTPARALLVETAVTYLDSFTEGGPVEEPDFLTTLAEAHVRVANVQGGIRTGNEGRITDALATMHKAQELLREASRLDPDNPDLVLKQWRVQFERGDLVYKSGKVQDALETYERASRYLDDLEELQGAAPKRQRAMTLIKIADCNRTMELPQLALSQYERSTELRRELLAADPDNSNAARDLTVALGRLAKSHADAGRHDRADQFYDEAIEIRTNLAVNNPESARFKRDLMVAQYQLAAVRFTRGDTDAAAVNADLCLKAAQELVAADPTNLRYQEDIGRIFSLIGGLQDKAGDKDGAVSTFRQYRTIATGLVERDEQNNVARRAVAEANYLEGATLADLQRYDEARERLDEAVAQYTALVESDPLNVNLRISSLWPESELAGVYFEQGDTGRAVQHAQAALGQLPSADIETASERHTRLRETIESQLERFRAEGE